MTPREHKQRLLQQQQLETEIEVMLRLYNRIAKEDVDTEVLKEYKNKLNKGDKIIDSESSSNSDSESEEDEATSVEEFTYGATSNSTFACPYLLRSYRIVKDHTRVYILTEACVAYAL